MFNVYFKIMKKILFLSILGLTLSCSNESTGIDRNDSTVLKQSNFYKIYNSEAKNHIMIESLSGIYDKNDMSKITSISLNGTPMDIILNGKKITGTLDVQGKGGSWSSPSDVFSFFGKKITLKKVGNNLMISENPLNKGEEEEGINIYIPEIISASVSNLVNGNLAPGSIITWNKDQSNLSGISMMIEYNPYEQTKNSVTSIMPEHETRVNTVDDNGYHVVTEDDLKFFPKGANLSFYIGRTAYVIGVDGEIVDDTSIGAITAARADFEISY